MVAFHSSLGPIVRMSDVVKLIVLGIEKPLGVLYTGCNQDVAPLLRQLDSLKWDAGRVEP